MKSSSISILAATSLLLAGCSLFHGSKHDPAAAPLSSGASETRYWDPQRNQWVTHAAEGTSSASGSAPAAAERVADAPAPPPTPRPSRQSGVYNSATGKIDWQSGGYVPPSAPTPAPVKHWWWPF